MKHTEQKIKTALVTGAASGLGFELALLLAKDGYNLVLVDIDAEKLQEAKVEITLDGNIYLPCEQNFHIYCTISPLKKIPLIKLASKIQVSTIFPRCASIQGGTQLTLTVPNLDDKTAKTLYHLTVGFQARSVKKGAEPGKLESLGTMVKKPFNF